MSFHDYAILQLANYVVPATLLAILALALNLQWGETGLFNAGVAAFVGIGAYMFGMLSTGLFADNITSWYHWGPADPWPYGTSLLGAMAVAGFLGLLVAVPTLRLRADYLAIATLALAEIVRLILKNERALTGGDQSLAFIPRPSDGLVARGFESDGVFMLFAGAILLLLLFLMLYLNRTPWGRALRAVREDEEAAEALGKDAFRLRLTAFAIGCAFMGLAGALIASFQGVVVPDQFAPATTFVAYVVVILGGSGNPRGVILGAFVFQLFGWGSQQLKVYLPESFALRIDFVNQIVIGLLLVVVILWRPEGISPEPKYVPRARHPLVARLVRRLPSYPPQWLALALAAFVVSGLSVILFAVQLHARVALASHAFGMVSPAASAVGLVFSVASAIVALGFAFVRPWARTIGLPFVLVDAAVSLTLMIQPFEAGLAQILVVRLLLAVCLVYVLTLPSARSLLSSHGPALTGAAK